GRDVPHAVTVRTAREPTVRDECGVCTAAGALHRTGDCEHLPHPGTTLRAFVADHHDVAGVDPPAEDGIHRLVFAVEDTRDAFEGVAVEPGDLHHRAVGRHRAPQHHDAALG